MVIYSRSSIQNIDNRSFWIRKSKIEQCNPDKENKVLIVFDDMISDMISKKKINPIITGLFSRSRKTNISVVFITQSYFKIPKEARLPKRTELQ